MNNEELHGVLKGNLAQKLWAVDAFMGAICRGGGSSFFSLRRGFNFAVNPPHFGVELVM